MTRGPAPFWAWTFGLVSAVAFVASFILAVTFTTGGTSYVESIKLKDPAGTAGQLFGVLVLWPLTLSLGFGLYWFGKHVLSQLGTYNSAVDLWEKLNDKLQGARLLPGNEADELVRSIAHLQPRDARVVRAAWSWLDPSPDSDAEMVIEGAANRCRQHLSLLQALASILVLIGLVGNFFGLSEAVSKMHELVNISESPAQVQQAQASGPSTPDSTGTYHDSIPAPTSSSSNSSQAQAAAGQSISNITKGLQVVVVSSVLGIGGMIVLLLFVSIFRNFFNHLVGEEVMLMATEIGSAVRPGAGDSSAQLQEALKTLNSRLESLDVRNKGLGKLTKQLDDVLARHLQAEDNKFEQFSLALTRLNDFLESRNEALATMFTSAVKTSSSMETMAQSINNMGTSLTKMVASQEQTLTDLATYASLVRTIAEDDTKQSKDRHEHLVDSLADRMDERMEKWLTRVDKERETYLQRTKDVLEETKNSLSALLKRGDKQTEDNRAYLEGLQEKTQQGLVDVKKDWTALLKDWLDKLDKAETAQQQTRQELTEKLEAVLTALRERLPETGEALQKVSGEVQVAHEALHKNMSTLLTAVTDLMAAQQKTGETSRAILEEAARTLKGTEETVRHLQERWNISVEEVAREVFQQWLEQQSPQSETGILATELKTLTARLADGFKKDEPGKVCSACGSSNAPDEAYCKVCGISLEKALPPGSFPVRVLAEHLQAIQKTIEAKPDPVPPAPVLDPALFESLQATLRGLQADLQKRSERVQFLPPLSSRANSDSQPVGVTEREIGPEPSRANVEAPPTVMIEREPDPEPEPPAKRNWWSSLLRKKS